MKHFYALMLMYVASVISGFAATNMYQLYIDHADRVSVSINGDVKNNLNDGLNNIFIDDVPSYGVYVSVSTISDDYGLESITNGNNEPVSIYSGNQASLVFDSSEASHYYKITTKNLLLARTSTLYV